MERVQVQAKTLWSIGSGRSVSSGTRASAFPGDEVVCEGVRTRKAYGGSATRSSFAILCALMEAEHREEARSP